MALPMTCDIVKTLKIRPGQTHQRDRKMKNNKMAISAAKNRCALKPVAQIDPSG